MWRNTAILRPKGSRHCGFHTTRSVETWHPTIHTSTTKVNANGVNGVAVQAAKAEVPKASRTDTFDAIIRLKLQGGKFCVVRPELREQVANF